jgi:hypothetical protein
MSDKIFVKVIKETGTIENIEVANQEWFDLWIENNFDSEFIYVLDDENKAVMGGSYNFEKNKFIDKQPYDSWLLNKETLKWEAPISYPVDGKQYIWDEENLSWEEDILINASNLLSDEEASNYIIQQNNA